MLNSIKPIIKKMPVIKTYVQKLQKANGKAAAVQKENEKLKREISVLTLEMQRARVQAWSYQTREWTKSRKKNAVFCEENPKVSIIILNRNGRHHLEILMKSLQDAEFYDNFEIIVVDNASVDDSVSFLERYHQIFDLTIIQNQENMSFSAANNLAAGAATGDYLLFLNNDTEVTDGWLDELLITAMEKKQAGAVGARLIYPEIPEGCKNAQKSFTIQHDGIGFRDAFRNKTYFVQPYNRKNGTGELKADMDAAECACVTAAVLLVSKEAFEKIGGFDENYLYGYEDVDLCLKLHKAGYHNYCCPACMVFHYEFGTQNQDDPKEVKERRLHNMHVFQGKWQTYLQRRILNEKLDETHVFTEQRLLVAFALEDEANAAVKLFAGALEKTGCEIKYLCRENEKQDWYDVGRETDVLIVLTADYEVCKVKNTKNSLIKTAWVTGEEAGWRSRKAFENYAFILVASEKECGCIKAHDCPGAESFPLPYSKKDAAEAVQTLREILRKHNVQRINRRKIDICGPMPNDETKKFWGDYHYAAAMKKELEKRGYEVDVRPYQRWYDNTDSAYTIVLRGNRPYYPKEEPSQRNIMWNISHPADVPEGEYNRYDFVYFASEKLARRMEGKLKTKCGVLLQCTDPEVMKSDGSRDKKYELLFVGNSRRVYRQVIQDALTLPYKLTIYGRHWDEFPEAQKCVKEAYMPNDQVGQTYRDAKIVLNDHWEDMREAGIVSNRLFDALAAEAFVISDYMPEIEELFEETIVTYKDRREFAEIVDYYMNHPDEAQKLAEKGHRLVVEKHTFAHRIDTLLQEMEQMEV